MTGSVTRDSQSVEKRKYRAKEELGSSALVPLLQVCILSICYYHDIQVEPKRSRSRSSVCKSGPVRSFGPKLEDRDRDQSTFILELKKTGLVMSLAPL